MRKVTTTLNSFKLKGNLFTKSINKLSSALNKSGKATFHSIRLTMKDALYVSHSTFDSGEAFSGYNSLAYRLQNHSATATYTAVAYYYFG